MKRKRVVTVLLAVAGLAIGLSNNALAEELNSAQRTELYREGRITDSQASVWDVRIIPGTRKIKRNANQTWRKIGDRLGDLVSAKYYRDDLGDLISSGFEYAKDATVEYWIKGIKRDVTGMIASNSEVRQTRPFGQSFIVLSNYLTTTTKFVGRTATFPIGVAGGTAYAVAAPVASVTWKPVASVLQASTGGSLVPAAAWVWNGTAWICTWNNEIPTQESEWVRLVRS